MPKITGVIKLSGKMKKIPMGKCPSCGTQPLHQPRVAKVDEATPLTAVQRKWYLAHPCHCPFCRHAQVEGESIEVEGSTASQEVHCLKCQRYWRDIYTLTGVEEVADG